VRERAAFVDVAAQHGVFFYYCGYFTQAIIEASADAIVHRMEAAGLDEIVKRRVISSFIEMGQNIVHYSAERLSPADAIVNEIRFGTLLIARTEDGVVLSCSNPVDRETYSFLGPKLEAISRMNLEGIRAAYREALRAELAPQDKGGGLGLLTLARGASCPIDYRFTPSAASPELMVFELRITV
jgi:hypothetical protein